MQTGIMKEDYERNLSVWSKFKQNLNDLKQPQNHKKKRFDCCARFVTFLQHDGEPSAIAFCSNLTKWNVLIILNVLEHGLIMPETFDPSNDLDS